MKTIRTNYGPFQVVRKSITATLKHGKAFLTCDVQKGNVGARSYKFRPQWFIRYEGQPCAMGPWSAKAIREHFTV